MRFFRPVILTCGLLALGCGDSQGPGRPPERSPRAQPAAPAARSAPATYEASADSVLVVTDADFQQQVLQSPQPVMVDVWAAWCHPCRVLAPTVEEVAREYQGRAVVAKLDADANPKVPNKYRVSGLPTLLFFKDGELVQSLAGVRPKSHYTRVLDSLVEP